MARDIASWIARNNAFGGGALKKDRTCIRIGSGVVVSWCFGHLLEQAPPEKYNPAFKSWRLSDLPIIPNEFLLTPRADAADQLRALGALIKEADEIIHAGDAGDEGQLLVSEVIDYFKSTKPVRRLWLKGLNDPSIEAGMNNLRPDAEYRGYYESALARSRADWIVGINMTRACTILGRRRGSEGVLSVGRVQTPTLALIVKRELEIRNFKAKDYYTPWVSIASEPGFSAKWATDETDDRVDDEGYLLSKEVAEKIVSGARQSGHAVVEEYTASKRTESQPLPFSLSALQTLMDARFGLSAQQTLDIAQSLYEKKVTSYPRTDSDYLLESQHAEAPGVLASLQGLDPKVDLAISGAKLSIRSKAWNDEKVSDHHAIIPLQRSGSASLSRDEERVYLEIIKRYCLQFWPAAEFLDTRIELSCDNERYRVRGKTYIGMGWRAAFDGEADDDEAEDKKESVSRLPQLKKGDRLQVAEAGYESSKTSPPKRYTEGTLLTAMKTVHRLITNEKLKRILKEQTGIGTEATRASIIETLFARKYIAKKGKALAPTKIGELLICALPSSITAPDLTAYWQQKMNGMREGEGTHEPFLDEQSTWLRKLLPQTPEWFERVTFGEIKPQVEIKETDISCPSCGKHSLRHVNGRYGWFFGCPGEECKARFKDVDGKPVKTEPPKMTGKTCPACKKGELSERTGPHGAYYHCEHKTCGKNFSAAAGVPTTVHACPKCKKGMMRQIEGRNGPFWGCSEYRNGCRFTAEDADGKPDLTPKKRKEAA